MTTEDMLRILTQNVSNMQTQIVHNQEETRSSIKNIEKQIGQISGAVSKLEAKESDRLPSQTEPNPRPNVSAITLRSGKELVRKEKPLVSEKEIEDEVVVERPQEKEKNKRSQHQNHQSHMSQLHHFQKL